MTDTISCLVCGRLFFFLPRHLKAAHGISVAEYRAEYGIPAGVPLAGDDYRQKQREKLLRMQAEGLLTYDHLPIATAAARKSARPAKVPIDVERHAAMLQSVKPWAVNQLPAGSKRADGRDADRAREYQREYRAKKGRKK